MQTRGFLKEIIYRIDFRFLEKETCEGIYSFLCSRFGNDLKCFRYEKVHFNNQADLDDESNKVMVLSTEDNREAIKLGRECIIVDLQLKQEKDDKQYNDWVSDIVEFIKETFKDKIHINRVGIRKNNRFYIEDDNINKINEVFSNSFVYTDLQNSLSLESIEVLESKQTFRKDNAYLCILKKLDTGYLSDKRFNIANKKAHNVCFDFDYFYPNQDCIDEFMNDPKNFLNKVQRTILDSFEQMVTQKVRETIDDKQKMYNDYGVILVD